MTFAEALKLYLSVMIKILISSLVFAIFAMPAAAVNIVLSVNDAGRLIKDGLPYRAIGVNYFDAFSRTLANKNDLTYIRGFEELHKHNIPFARVMLSGYWPIQFKLYRDDPVEYFSRMDGVIAAATQFNVGIVASLNWNPSAIPDLVGEPISAWGNKNSKTIAFMRKYTSDIVQRYAGNPAIWIWEFGNEYSLLADLPLLAARMNRPQINVSKGTPQNRSDQDDLRFQDIRVAFDEFSRAVRSIDSHRIISTGNSLPRPFAYHNSRMRNWALDSNDQFCEVIGRDNPDPYQVVSIHVYLQTTTNRYFGAKWKVSDLVNFSKKCSQFIKKPLFLGEFGFERKDVSGDIKDSYKSLIDSIVSTDVDLAAMWVYDFKFHDNCCSFDANGGYSYVLDLLQGANAVLEKGK